MCRRACRVSMPKNNPACCQVAWRRLGLDNLINNPNDGCPMYILTVIIRKAISVERALPRSHSRKEIERKCDSYVMSITIPVHDAENRFKNRSGSYGVSARRDRNCGQGQNLVATLAVDLSFRQRIITKGLTSLRGCLRALA